MHKLELNENFLAEGDETAETRIGQIHHVHANEDGGGAVRTPIARYFVWQPNYSEGVKPHWRIDCFVKRHELSGDPKALAKMLTRKFLEIELCHKPIWTSWYECTEIAGELEGDLREEE